MTKLAWIDASAATIAAEVASRSDEKRVDDIVDATMEILEHLSNAMVTAGYLTLT